MTTKWHQDRMTRQIKWNSFCTDLLVHQHVMEIIWATKPDNCIFADTTRRQEEATKTWIADICANERQLKQ